MIKPLPLIIWISCGEEGKGFWHKVECVDLQKYCINCIKQGHHIGECKAIKCVKRTYDVLCQKASTELLVMKNDESTKVWVQKAFGKVGSNDSGPKYAKIMESPVVDNDVKSPAPVMKIGDDDGSYLIEDKPLSCYKDLGPNIMGHSFNEESIATGCPINTGYEESINKKDKEVQHPMGSVSNFARTNGNNDGFSVVVSKSTKKNLQKLQKDKQHEDKFDLEENFLLDQVHFDDPKCLSYHKPKRIIRF